MFPEWVTKALAAISIQLDAGRLHRSVLSRSWTGARSRMTTRELGLEYFAKRKTGSGGRMMPSHYSDADRHIWSVPTPTGSQLLPACGIAWGIQLDGKKNLVVTTVGDAATRQGDFFEAICFAKERKLPVLFIVEDNAYGISSPTRKINPLALDCASSLTTGSNSTDKTCSRFTMQPRMHLRKFAPAAVRSFFWVKMERLSSHTSSDDQKLYRSAEELRGVEKLRSAQVLERSIDRRRSAYRGGIREARQRNKGAGPAGIQRGRKSGGPVA